MNNNKPHPPPGDGGRFTSEGCDLLEVREEDTQPGIVSESYRKYLREKYGRKEPPSPPQAKDA